MSEQYSSKEQHNKNLVGLALRLGRDSMVKATGGWDYDAAAILSGVALRDLARGNNAEVVTVKFENALAVGQAAWVEAADVAPEKVTWSYNTLATVASAVYDGLSTNDESRVQIHNDLVVAIRTSRDSMIENCGGYDILPQALLARDIYIANSQLDNQTMLQD